MGKRIREYYISIDVEADGPCPGMNSMLQCGAVFYDFNGQIVSEYKANLFELEGASQDAGTMKWWADQEEKFPGIWDRMMKNRIEPYQFCNAFSELVSHLNKELDASPVCVAYPAGYDFTWLYYYLCRFNGSSCVGFSCLDLKTLGMALINNSYHNSSKRRFPEKWFNPKLKHTHDGLDDARGQGYMFFQMVRDARNLHDAANTVKTPAAPLSETEKLLFKNADTDPAVAYELGRRDERTLQRR